MSARTGVYALLSQDTELIELGFGEVYNIEAVDNPDRSSPFLVTAWGEAPPTRWGTSGTRSLLVWAHDRSADYSNIDAALSRVKELLVGVVHQGGISQIAWTGDSPDLYDDGFRTITRNSGYRINEESS